MMEYNAKKHPRGGRTGFTLIELLIVMTIIGILSGVVLVSTKSSVDKSRRTSALTTASSVLPEIVTCQDDGGNLRAYSAGTVICDASGHSATWPNLAATALGWSITAGAVSNNNIPSNYTYTANATGQTGITCNLATSSCL